jgi:hypothetical protein
MALIHRVINVSFLLDSGTFGGQGGGTNTLSFGNTPALGYRITAKVNVFGGDDFNTLDLRVYGMSLSHMNSLSTLGNVPQGEGGNTVTVNAGDAVNGMTQVFTGQIFNAFADMQAMPEVAFQVYASTTNTASLKAASATTFKGPKQFSDVMQTIAGKMGVPFQNNGVTAVLSNPYFSGTPREQALACIKAAAACWNGVDKGTLAAWPPNQSMGGGGATISKDNGMVGYPAFTSNGILVKTLFNPGITYGETITVISDIQIPGTTNQWDVDTLKHYLESETPNGQWFSTIGAHQHGSIKVGGT